MHPCLGFHHVEDNYWPLSDREDSSASYRLMIPHHRKELYEARKGWCGEAGEDGDQPVKGHRLRNIDFYQPNWSSWR